MKNRLFWRLFLSFTAAIVLTVTMCSFFMVAMVRAERESAMTNEVTLQARDIAYLLSQQDELTAFRVTREHTISSTLAQKIKSLRETYSCTVWMVYSGGRAYTIGNDVVSSEQLTNKRILSELQKVLSGEEIIVNGLLPDNPDTVTVGVPWGNERGRIEGAVMLHISTADMTVDYSDLIRNALISVAAALIPGILLSLLISSSQTGPIKKIRMAVTRFSEGELDSRINLNGHGELTELADSIDKMTEELSTLEKSRRSFVASVSHELRSPLTCIRGYIEGIQDGTIPYEEQSKYLDIVMSETDRLSALVNDLLNLSRIESGKVPLNLSNFDINEEIRLALIRFEPKIDAKRLQVDARLRDEPIYVNADKSRISQVLTNLIDNAIKFLPEGGLLTVSAHQTANVCSVSIKDNGPGISPDDLPFIFDRFYKADKAHTSGMGTGLGLSIVQKILEQHGQTIKVNSVPGNGAEFIFTLAPGSDKDNPISKERQTDESL